MIAETNRLIGIINLVNGKFRTAKIKFIYKAISHFNIVYNTNIEKLPVDDGNLKSNT